MSQLESCVQTQVSPSIYETISTAIKLTKPTISLLVVITTLPSIFIAANGFPSLVLVFAALVGSGLASASAAAFNPNYRNKNLIQACKGLRKEFFLVVQLKEIKQ